MPQVVASKHINSLFSLELVVDKLYIPHSPCRFPAIAFRLLDYPTIIIKHVDDDLAAAIHKKVSFDPVYQLPDQFSELKDQHGNFLVRSGKSCLFKISADILKQHLANTPLYVMVIDLFPDVPKLVGNSSVPLDLLMDSICVDIAKLGSTVPSVHGDKGLFKLYNLMGKEIGYFILGFRLLYLGPNLVSHLPESSLMHNQLKIRKVQEANIVDDILKTIDNLSEEEEDSEEPVVALTNSASMTIPIKHDVVLQRVEDKAISVPVSDLKTEQTKNIPYKESQNISTQTERSVREAEKTRQKWKEIIQNKIDVEDNNEVIVSNIICPPPLFYNSQASPVITIERLKQHSPYDDMSVEDLSDIESYHGYGLQKEEMLSKKDNGHTILKQPTVIAFQPKKEVQFPPALEPQARVGETIHSLEIASETGAVFPLLTALINELTSIQNPQLLLHISHQLQDASCNVKRPVHPELDSNIQYSVRKDNKLSPSVVTTVAAALIKKAKNSKEQKMEKSYKSCGTRTFIMHPKVTKTSNTGTKAEVLPRKGKLVYGMTNTQRLRLQKTNPQWLKLVEKDISDLKSKKQSGHSASVIADMNAEAFDTHTEVRYLAEKELTETGVTDTLINKVQEIKSTNENKNKNQKPNSGEIHCEERDSHRDESHNKSPSINSLQNKQNLKATSRKKHRQAVHESFLRKDFSNLEEQLQKQPLPFQRHKIRITSPTFDCQDQWGVKDGINTDSDLSSTKSDSLKVRPFTKPGGNESCTTIDADDNQINATDDEDDIPLPDDSLIDNPKSQVLNFPRYIAKVNSLPGSVYGTANASLSLSDMLDDNSPLESTHQNLASNQNDSKILQSTEYGTQQFHSTDEYELQRLMSEEEYPVEDVDSGRRSVASLRTSQKFQVIIPQLSENSPIPSVRKSTSKLEPTAQGYLPSASSSKGHSSPASLSPKPSMSETKDIKFSPSDPKSGNLATSKSIITPRSTSSSSRHPTPRPRRFQRESIHTDSLSSYMPSDPENVIVSLSSSNSEIYSNDFQSYGSGESECKLTKLSK